MGDGKFCEELMLNQSVPDAIVELARCKCKKGCKTNSCSCKLTNLVCKDLCSCNIDDNCENISHYTLYEKNQEENY